MEHLRNILLGVLLLRSVSWHHAADTSLEVTVVDSRHEIECITNSTFGVDWKFSSVTSEYNLYHDGTVPLKFNKTYSVTNGNYSSGSASYLSIKRVKKSSVGTYICLKGENQQIVTTVQLALLTLPICEPDTNSSTIMRRSVCNFTFVGNNSELTEEICVNSTSMTCSGASDGTLHCEFPINKKNLTSLRFATNLFSDGIETCEISCNTLEATSADGFQTTGFNVSIQCFVNHNLTSTNTIRPTSTTTTRSPETTTGSELYLYGSIGVSVIGLLITLIIIAIFRGTNVCNPRRCIPVSNKEPSPTEQIDDQFHYFELEAPYAEIPDNVIEDNAIEDNNKKTAERVNSVVDNDSYYLVPISNNVAESRKHLGNPELILKDTRENATTVVNPEYAVPYDVVPTLPYAQVYQKETEHTPSRKSQ